MKDRFLRWKATVWSARPCGAYPNAYVEVGPNNSIEVFISLKYGETMEGFRIPDRRLARLVAKRIEQCLDETK